MPSAPDQTYNAEAAENDGNSIDVGKRCGQVQAVTGGETLSADQ